MCRVHAFAIASLLLTTVTRARAAAPQPDVRETPLGDVNPVVVETVTPSRDGRRVAWAARAGEKLVLTVDGKATAKPYDGFAVGGIVFSPSSARVGALVSTAGNKWLLVLDGKEGKTFDTFADGSLRFSPDSEHVAVVAARGQKRLAVVDGVEGALYDDVKAFAFAPGEGNRYAYAAREGARWRVVTETETGDWFDEVGDGAIAYGPDGKRIAYAARRFDRWFVVDEGKPGAEHDEIAAGSVRFSPDGAALAYAVRRGAAWSVAVNGKAGERAFDEIDAATLAFTPDGKSVVFAARASGGWAVVEGETPGPSFEELAFPPAFGPGAGRPTYVGVRAGRHVVVHDGKETWTYDEVMEAPVFGPDGRVAFAARRGGQQFAVLDGKDGPPFDAVGRLAFSPDGKQFAYGAQRGNTAVVRIDDVDTPTFTGFLPRSRLVFEPDGGALHAQTFRGPQLFQVRVGLAKDEEKQPAGTDQPPATK